MTAKEAYNYSKVKNGMKPGHRSFLYALIPVVLALIAAAPSLTFEFVADDSLLIVENKDVHSLRGAVSLLGKDFFARDIVGMPIEGGIGYYRPLTKISFAIDWFMWGKRPMGFHLTNGLLHAFATLLVFLLGLGLFSSKPGALIAATLFALWPSHPQAVALINARSDLLCALGALVACWGAVRKAWPWVFWGTLLAMGSKETGVIVPGLVVLITGVREFRVDKKHILVGSSLAALAVYMVGRTLVLGPSVMSLGGPLSEVLREWFFVSGTAIGAHLYALLGLDAWNIWPVLLPQTWLDPALLLSWLLAVALGGSWVYAMFQKSVLSFVMFWIIGGFLPLLLAPKVNVPFSEFIVPLHERWTYIPSVGVALSVGCVLKSYRAGQLVKVAALSTAMIMLGVYWVRMMPYASDKSLEQTEFESLKRVSLEKLPNPLKAKRFGMEGIEAAHNNELDVAEQWLRKSLELEQNNPNYLSNLGIVLMQQGDLPQAVEVFQASLSPPKVHTDGKISTFAVDDHHLRGRPARYALLGEALYRAGAFSEAAEAFGAALQGDPYDARYALSLAGALAMQRRLDEAAVYYRRALSLKPCYDQSLAALEEISNIQSNIDLAQWVADKRAGCR